MQVSLPAVVSMTAVGWADVVAAGLAAVAAAAGFFAGVVLAAGVVCDHPAENAAAISKQIERQCRIEAPGAGFRPAGQMRTSAPTWVVMTAKYDSILEFEKS